jgi:hypothetical protein
MGASRLVRLKSEPLDQHGIADSGAESFEAPPTTSQSDGESYADRVAKYVPGEIVAGYAVLYAIVQQVPESDTLRTPAAWAVFAICLVATPIYLVRVGRPSGQQWVQVVISSVAFVIWAYTLGGPFADTPGYRPWIGGLLVGLYTFLAGLFQPAQLAPKPLPVSP